ncbi:GNAT family N-acetyltransferase [Halanaerobium sp.]|jgi:ElaA protein|uniref:GNAT family N-acetyltransferase n=1 Tax=Halanaerobium sp. TaxID=1895664 RepID=UPI000DE5E3F6|nr:GNAT family N-acetyltransferase [Halanaerobium sp.]PUU89578.1 MAG: ElaA protein [Halanaerobium sp.]
MELKIKKFSELSNQELYKIIEARINVFVVEQNCPYKECDNKDQNSFHLFYQKEGEIAAYLRIIPAGISYPEISIGRVLVKDKYRRNGLANKLMQAALSYIKNNFKTEAVRISAQEYILDFYQQLGFEVVSERYLEDDIPHFEMLNKL